MAHLQPGEEADVHEGVHVLQVFVDVESGDESCRMERKRNPSKSHSAPNLYYTLQYFLLKYFTFSTSM